MVASLTVGITLSTTKTFSFWANVQPRGPGATSGYIGVDNNTAESRWYVDDNFNGDGARIYREQVRPAAVSLERIISQYGSGSCHNR